MLGTQSVAVLILMTVPVMATEIAPDFGVDAKDIGVFMSIVFVFAMFFSAASGSLVHRFGGIRTNQIGMAFSACCLLLALTKSLPLLFVGAALIGLGYGPNTPAGSHVLARVTPANAMGLVFSFKQSGAPLGGLVAGLLVPTVAESYGWETAIYTSFTVAALAIVGIQPLRDRLDDDRDPNTKIVFSSPWRAIRSVALDRRLRRLTFAAFSLTSTQAIVMTYLVVFLIQELGIAFTTAGAVFACSQAAGATVRVLMGWLADKALGARTTLVMMGMVSSTGLVGLTFLSPDSPLLVIVTLSVILGAASFGWNGVFLAEVASEARSKSVGEATGGSLFFLYGGLVFGPMIMSLLITMTSGYTVPFFAFAALTWVACLNLFRTKQ